MWLSKASLLIGLLFSAALLVSARALAETAEKTESRVEAKYYDHDRHRYPPPTDHPDYYCRHRRGYPHYPVYYCRHYPPSTERKTLESYDVKPSYYHHGYGGYGHGGGYPYGHHSGGYPHGHHGGGYPYRHGYPHSDHGAYPFGHHGGGYPYHHGGYHGGYGGHYPPPKAN